MRAPSSILKYLPNAFAGEPKILPANSRLTTATRGEPLSSCNEKVLPARKAVAAALKYAGDILNLYGTAAAFDGRRSVVSSVKIVDSPQAPLTNGAQSTNPTESTPGSASIASRMRFCISGTLSPLYPALLRSVSTSIAFFGSNPKSACSERTSPRTATIDDVTSTAQIAICTTNSTSRAVIRRPTEPVDPALTIWYGLALRDRKSTRLNSSHTSISYAVFSLKKKKIASSYT